MDRAPLGLGGCHGLARARSRGTSRMHIQALLAATAVNLKRLLTHDNAHAGPAVASGEANAITPPAPHRVAKTPTHQLIRSLYHTILTTNRHRLLIPTTPAGASLTAS